MLINSNISLKGKCTNIIFFLLGISTLAFSQQRKHNILAANAAKEVWFDGITGVENSGIYNGPEYKVAFKGYKTDPFYQATEPDATIMFDGNIYNHVQVLYDIFTDNIIVKYPASSGAVGFIQLDKRRVERFDAYGHHFKKFNKQIVKTTGEVGFFDVLFEGSDISCVAKRIKYKRVEGKSQDYSQDDLYFIINGGKWLKLIGSKSFLKALPGKQNKENRKKLKTFISQNHLSSRREENFAKIAAYCNTLK
jgi:hypothetical protein